MTLHKKTMSLGKMRVLLNYKKMSLRMSPAMSLAMSLANFIQKIAIKKQYLARTAFGDGNSYYRK